MREHLLGYLLGALELHEQQDIEARLREDLELRRELDLLREGLRPLAADREDHAPPPGLAAHTCRHVAMQARYYAQFATTGGWRLQDLLVAAGIFVAASLLVFPAVSNSHYKARLTACQNNLRMLGDSLRQYSRYHGDYFPLVPPSGKLAAAGIYAPRLLEDGYLQAPQQVVCPASPLAEDRDDFRIPTLAELQAATPAVLVGLHRRMGGSYGYAFGYMQDDRYHGIRNRSRSTFALMADTPLEQSVGSSNHGRCGQNVLFEDGHVQFLKNCRLQGNGDHIFRNGHGYVGAGIGPDDSVIGSSEAAPIVLETRFGR